MFTQFQGHMNYLSKLLFQYETNLFNNICKYLICLHKSNAYSEDYSRKDPTRKGNLKKYIYRVVQKKVYDVI